MADCCSRSVATLVAILLFVGIGGMICGAIGTSWFTQSRLDTHVGLLKSCTRILGRCTERKNILKFKEEHEAFFVGVESRSFDYVLIFIIGSGAAAILGLITSFSMCCIGDRSYRCVAFILNIFTFLAAGSSVTAIVFSEVFIKREIPASEINLYEHGWSSIMAWAGAGCMVLAFVISLVTCCAVPRDKYANAPRTAAYDENTGFKYTPNNRYTPAYSSMPRGTDSLKNNNAADNAGYQLR